MRHHPNSSHQPAADPDDQFYVLTVGHKNVRLYQGDRTSLHTVHIPGLPADMEQTLGIDENANERSVHSVVRAGRNTQVSAGQYNAPNTDKIMLQEFFRTIDHLLHRHLTDTGYPLILAGVDYVQTIYRSVNTYPHIVGQGIPGNQDDAPINQLHRRALAILDLSPTES